MGSKRAIRLAIEGILASPRFVFRFEERPATARAGQGYAIGDFDLASRLSYLPLGDVRPTMAAADARGGRTALGRRRCSSGR